MALPATDDFAGTGALSASWTAFGAGLPERNSGAAMSATGSGGANGFAWWNADAFDADQVSTIVLGANYGQCAAGVRMTGTGAGDNDGYQLWVIDSTTIEVYRLDDGSFNSLGTRTVTTLVADDEITLEISGSTLTAKVNGVQQGATFSDATYSSGAAGFATSEEVADHVRSWTGDNLGGAATALAGALRAAGPRLVGAEMSFTSGDVTPDPFVTVQFRSFL